MEKIYLKKVIEESSFNDLGKKFFCNKNLNFLTSEFIQFYEFPENYVQQAIYNHNLNKQLFSNEASSYQENLWQDNSLYALQNKFDGVEKHMIKKIMHSQEDYLQEYKNYYQIFIKQSQKENFWEKCRESYAASHILIMTSPELDISFADLIKIDYDPELNLILDFFLNQPYKKMELNGFWLSSTEQLTVVPEIIQDRFSDYLENTWTKT